MVNMIIQLEKAQRAAGLVREMRHVTRNGQSFDMAVWVRPGANRVRAAGPSGDDNRQGKLGIALPRGALLAPNGKSSNLSPAQWHQCRTQAFKDWFGDWEHDPKNASKVVDNNGEPLVVYRGSTIKLKDGKIPDVIRGSQLGSAYFTTDKEVADSYARTSTPIQGKEREKEARNTNPDYNPTITECFLNIRNPATEKNKPQDVFSLEEMSEYLSQFNPMLEYDQSKETVDESIDKYTDLDYSGKTMPENLRRLYAYADATGDLDRIYKKFDGVIFKDQEAGGTTLVPYRKNQIKSATENEGSFNPEITDITKSLTFSGWKLQGRKKVNGMDISIENRKGTTRRGIDKDGHKWASKMYANYGYVRGSEGVDGDHVDVYLGPNIESQRVFIINQNDPVTGSFDEQKVMLGFNSPEEAKALYLKQYDRKGFFGSMKETDIETFKQSVFKKKNHGKRILLGRQINI